MKIEQFKFLAFDKKCQSIHEVRSINFTINEVVCKGLKFFDSDIILGFNEYELMPSTTLKDLQGKEMYGGQIVKCTGCSFPAEIVWYEGMWALETYREESRNNPMQSCFFDEATIIGNIYQNPDLLPTKKRGLMSIEDLFTDD